MRQLCADDAVALRVELGVVRAVGDQDRVIRHPRQEGTRLDEPTSILHLPGAGLVDGLVPGHQGVVDRRATGLPHLPDRVVPVGVPEGPGEQIPIQRPADVGGDRVAFLDRSEPDRVVLVDWLAIQYGLDRCPVVVDPRIVVTVFKVHVVAVLPHVEIQPRLVVEILSRALAAARMERHQVPAAVALAYPASHGAHQVLVLLVPNGTVAAQNPDHVLVPIPLPEPLTVDFGVLHGEERLPVLHLIMPVPPPRREKADVHSQRVGLVHNVVHVVPVVVVGTVLHSRTGGILIDQRQMPVGVRVGVSVQLRQCHCLDHRISFVRPVFQIPVHLFTVQTVKQLPGGVAQPEERLAILANQETLVVGNLQPGQVRKRGCRHSGQENKNGVERPKNHCLSGLCSHRFLLS